MRSGLFVRAVAMVMSAAALVEAGSGAGSAPAAAARRISVDLRGQTLRDALAYIEGAAGVEMSVYWMGADGRAGLDPAAVLDVNVRRLSVEDAVERVLASLRDDEGDAPAWQASDHGGLEIGPRSRLNEHHRVEVYSVEDLIREAPNFGGAPVIDLNAALKGGGGSVLREDGVAPEGPAEPVEPPIERLARLVTTLVEPAQWRENGGEGASMHIFRGSLVVDAPGYIHRQIGGALR